ncbi:MAG: glycosyltransferase [Flavobacteriales bacterium]|nr:GDP-mannose-dependent alpha-(1-6)-phosphatidylinositol monomannoside mannosyltransferase [Flavobacteriales bacterium]MCC6576462.1 glycosyltransferase [Flavobacteriales bacterium]
MTAVARLCIVSPNRNAYSETFIAAHLRRLPGVALVLTDGHLPRRDAGGALLLPPTLARRVASRLLGATPAALLERRIARLLARHRLQVVLAEYGPTGEAMLEPCRRAGIPLVVHFHGVDAFHVKLLKDHGGYRRILEQAAAVVVVSREMERQLLALGADRARLHYNCYGIDVEQFRAGRPDQAPPHFLAVGRFVDKKAPHLTLLAFHQAWRRDPAMRLTMAGNGPLWDSTRQLVAALGLEGVVELPGVLTPQEVAARMAASRAFVQHSVITADNDHEGTPLSVLEAMASGLPVVSTRHAGIPDVVEHEVSGLLGAERDLDAMAGHLLRLAADPALALRMGRAGREAAEQRHRVEDSLARLAAILAGVARR